MVFACVLIAPLGSAQPSSSAAPKATASAAGGDKKPTSAHKLPQATDPDVAIYLRPAPKVSVLTFGPGDAAFLKFGHNAIRVQDPATKTDFVYNFGTFRFDNPFLIIDFLTGKFQYWLSVTTFDRTLAYYKAADRDVVEQELFLGHLAAHQLNDMLRENARPENRAYLYDYYRDNCSTRVRDALDEVLKGALKERSQEPAKLTLREHTLRAVADDVWLYLGLDIAMGSYIDQPETRWTEMFLPEKLHDGLGRVLFSGVHGSAALVKERKLHYRSSKKNRMSNRPPERTFAFLKAGVGIGVVIAFLGWEAYRRRKRWAQAMLALLIGVYGLATGVLGLLFLFLWFGTNHVVAFHNENILQCAPWAVALPVCAWGIFRGKSKWIRLAFLLVQAALGAAVLGLLLKVFPFMSQQNERIIALLLPIWCGVLFALNLLRLRAMRPLLIPVEGDQEQREEDAASEQPEEDRSEQKKPPRRPEPDEEEESDEVPVGPNSQPAPA